MYKHNSSNTPELEAFGRYLQCTREKRDAPREKRDASREKRDASREKRDSSREKRDASREKRDASREKRDASRETMVTSLWAVLYIDSPTGFELDSAYFLRQRATPLGHAFNAITVHRVYVQQEILLKSAYQFNVPSRDSKCETSAHCL